MTDSKFIQRSTLLGFPVSAGVTPSRVIPPMQTRPDRYLKNPPATVISTQKTAVDQLGRSISPGSYMKKTRSEIPYTEKNKIIQMQKIETKQFSLTETKPIINTLPPKQSIIQPSKPETQLQGNNEFKDGVEYTTEVTTSPGGTRRIIKRPVRKSNIVNPQQIGYNQSLSPIVKAFTTTTIVPEDKSKVVPPPITKTTVISQAPVQPVQQPVMRTMIKLPDGRTVEKDSPEAQEFFKDIQKQNESNRQILPVRNTTSKPVPVLTATTIISDPQNPVPAGSIIDRSNYQRIEPTANKARPFDPNIRVIRRDIETPLYTSTSQRYLNNSTPSKSRAQDPVLARKQEHSPIVHRPHSEFTPWGAQKTSTPKRDSVAKSMSQIVQPKPVEKLRVEPILITTVEDVKKSQTPEVKQPTAHLYNYQTPVQKFESQLIKSKLIDEPGVKGSTPQTQQIDKYEELRLAIEHSKGLNQYQTGFDKCKTL